MMPNTAAIPKQIFDIITQVINGTEKSIALHQPLFKGNEWNYTKECIDTGWVSSVGKFVDRFEQMLVELTGAKFVVATVNGTSALHLTFLLANIKPNDEVLTPALTFIGTTNPITYCQAIPHFIDSDPETLGINLKSLEDYLKEDTVIKNGTCINKYTNRHIKALSVMHTFGHPADLDALLDLANRYHLILIEDAAEALGSYYKNIHVGHHGYAGILSFNGNKIATTGGGGAILTNDPTVAKRAKHLSTTAKLPHPWLFMHDQIGFNYRLPNINAALGCAQLEQLPGFLKAKRALAKAYQAAFKNLYYITFVDEPAHAKSNFWLNTIILDESAAKYRDNILEFTNTNGIMTRPAWNLQHTLPMYQSAPKMPLTHAEKLAKQIINLPSSVELGKPYV